MGLSNEITNTANLSTKLTIVGGKFTKRVEEGTEGAIARKLTKGKNEGNTVWELKCTTLKGTVTNIEVSDSEYPSLEVTVDDDNESFVVQFPLDSGYMRDFSSYMATANLYDPVSIELEESSRKNKMGNPYVNLKVVQRKHKLPHYYSEFKKDAQGKVHVVGKNGCPDVVETRSGKNYDLVNDFLITALEGLTFRDSPPTAQEYAAIPAVPDSVTDAGELAEDDDTNIPF